MIYYIGGCRLVKRYSKAQVWEFIIIVAIILLVLYRWAWLYDYVPDRYLPSTLISSGYSGVKNFLIEESLSPTVPGHVAESVVATLDSYEKYIKDVDSKYRLEEATAERCQENVLFRYFMHIGEDASQKCTESNLQLQRAVEEINNDAHPSSTPPAN